VPVAARSVATLTVEEVKPIETRYAVSQLSDDQVALFLRDAKANTLVSQALAPIQAKKSAIAALIVQIAALQSEARQIGEDQNRLRGNMEALKGSRDEQHLLKRYVAQLNQEEDRMDALHRQLADVQQTRSGAERDLADLIEALSVDVEVEADSPQSDR
jgi:DNA repair exonuclease SbcCD ATPase subunit